MKRRTLWGAAALAIFLWACTGPVGSTVGDALIDLGTAVSDVAGDAARAEVYDGIPCEEVVTTDYMVTSADGSTSATRTSVYYAEIETPIDVGRVSNVSGVVCGSMRSPTGPAPGCPSGSTCVGYTNMAREELDCLAANVTFDSTRARIFCGTSSSSRNTNAAGDVTSESGSYGYRTTARFIIE